jgi:hypothetical protein
MTLTEEVKAVLLDELRWLRDPDVSKVLEVLDRRGYEVRRKPVVPAPIDPAVCPGCGSIPVKVRTGRVTIKGVSYPMHSVPDNADVSDGLPCDYSWHEES